jgi:hypothetical protein
LRFAEVIVSGTVPGSGEPAALVFFGSRAGLASPPTYILAPEPFPDGGWFPGGKVSVGDVDGDGYGDFVITAPSASDKHGRVYLYRGKASGISTTPDLVLNGSASATFPAGMGALGAIDVDGDGRSELFVDATMAESGSSTTLVYRLPSTTPIAQFEGAGALGDFDCDGFGDLAIELPGKIEAHRGSASGFVPPEVLTLPIGPSYGGLVAIGDYDGDGCEDALWDDRFEHLSFWHGDASAFLVPGAPLGFPFAVADFGGNSIVLLGDADGDGRADIAAANGHFGFDVHLGSPIGPSSTTTVSFPAWDVGSSQ